jgi:hypothetical protein
MLNRFSFVFLMVAVVALILSGCSGTPPREVGELDDFATCVKDSGLKMYGSMTCSVCKRQRELFGSSFELVGEIECHPRGKNPQTELCFEKGIEKTPTWIHHGRDEQRLEGYQTLETLAEVSGCPLPGVEG